MDNECDGCKGQPVPGILSIAVGGRVFDNVERCDLCQRFGSDEVAAAVWEVVFWARIVMEMLYNDATSPDLGSNAATLDTVISGLLDPNSEY